MSREKPKLLIVGRALFRKVDYLLLGLFSSDKARKDIYQVFLQSLVKALSLNLLGFLLVHPLPNSPIFAKQSPRG
ncbi:hypothetical protein GCM10027291_00780 [Telluribacter humicola]